MKWWQIIPVGATLVSRNDDVVVFEHDGDGDMQRWTVDLWTDEVLDELHVDGCECGPDESDLHCLALREQMEDES